MSDSIQLEIVTPTDAPARVNIKQLYIPAYRGKAGVLENHKPYITLLNPGEIFYTDIMDKKFYLYIREGFMEVIENKIVIVSDEVERGEKLNKEEIEAKLAEVDKTIKASIKLVEGMTEDQMKKLPHQLAKVLEEQKEFRIKQEIVEKIEKG